MMAYVNEFLVRKRGHFQSVSLVFFYPKTQNPSSTGDDVVNGASERAREQSASSDHRYVPTKRVITSECNTRSCDHDDSPTAITKTKKNASPSRAREEIHRRVQAHAFLPLSAHKKAKKKNREKKKTNERPETLRETRTSRAARDSDAVKTRRCGLHVYCFVFFFLQLSRVTIK